jgi:hypothetical protein
MTAGPEADPILCLPHRSTADTIAQLRHDLAGPVPFDPERNQIGPAESRTNPEVALTARVNVLAATYRGDYHTDSFDIARLANQVRAGTEAIWFWGGEDEIRTLRRLLRSGTPDDVPDLELGTVTVLDAQEEFGPGYGELCRSGSTDRTCGAKAPIISRTLGFLDGSEAWLRARYHTLELTSRVRRSEPGVRGGEAIHRIHCRYARSRFWGYAPFYLMQRGVLEQLEYRESNRDPDDVRKALRASNGWSFADPDEASFAAALVRLNYGFDVPAATVPARPRASDHAVSVVMPKTPELVPANHGTVVPLGYGHATPVEPLPASAAVEQVVDSGVCCAVVWVPLEDPGGVGFQAWLSSLGFTLTAVVPPKHTGPASDGVGRRDRVPAFGIWSRPRPGLPIVPPYYADQATDLADEDVVLRYLRARFPEPLTATPRSGDALGPA